MASLALLLLQSWESGRIPCWAWAGVRRSHSFQNIDTVDRYAEQVLQKTGLFEALEMAPSHNPSHWNQAAHGKAGDLPLVPVAPASSLGASLDAPAIQAMWVKFDHDYPAEALEADNRPCWQLVQQVHLQKRCGELKYIPWKNILSEVQYDRSRHTSDSKERTLLALLAQASGIHDTVEGEVFASPFAVQKVLTSRALTWALVEWCHLGTAKTLR